MRPYRPAARTEPRREGAHQAGEAVVEPADRARVGLGGGDEARGDGDETALTLAPMAMKARPRKKNFWAAAASPPR